MLRVEFTHVRACEKCGHNRFYDAPYLRRKLPRAWRIVVDEEGALRTGFKRKIDAEMAKAAMERAGLSQGEAMPKSGPIKWHGWLARAVADKITGRGRYQRPVPNLLS